MSNHRNANGYADADAARSVIWDSSSTYNFQHHRICQDAVFFYKLIKS